MTVSTNKKIKLGMVGLSPGNGHPYSWGAICNGYDAEKMASCPFPVIPEYLGQQQFPQAQLTGVEVTHIWTQDSAVSKHVAAASLIPNVVREMETMIGQVDAVLLARDDAENHLTMAAPFLKAGLPIFIDKPLALTVATAQQLFDLQQYPGQLFTCSALRFAKELHLTTELRQKTGPVRHIQANVSKDWAKYAIHLIEPVLQMIDHNQPITACQVSRTTETRVATFTWESGLTTTFTTLGAVPTPITITVYGEKSPITLTFSDTFSAFRNSLAHFVAIVSGSQPPVDQRFVLKSVEMVERGSQ